MAAATEQVLTVGLSALVGYGGKMAQSSTCASACATN
jgi:hypothetical protein